MKGNKMVNYLNNIDERFQSKILRGNQVRREEFNPKLKDHLKSYQNFLKTGNWGEVQFFCEFPYVTVPETVSRKFACHTLAKMVG
jgi:hypothetical protein